MRSRNSGEFVFGNVGRINEAMRRTRVDKSKKRWKNGVGIGIGIGRNVKRRRKNRETKTVGVGKSGRVETTLLGRITRFNAISGERGVPEIATYFFESVLEPDDEHPKTQFTPPSLFSILALMRLRATDERSRHHQQVPDWETVVEPPAIKYLRSTSAT